MAVSLIQYSLSRLFRRKHMFAIVKIGGNQYKVSVGDTLVVDRLGQEVGQLVPFEALLVADGTDVKLGKEAKAIIVSTKIVSHGQGEKIHIRRFRAKSRHRRHIGFRHQLTTLTIESIETTKAPSIEKPKVAPRPKSRAKSVQIPTAS